MTPDERQQFLMETENSVRQFAAQIASRMSGSTGIPKPPEIVVTETETETERFGLKLDPKDESTSASPGAPSTPPTCPCLTITFSGVSIDCACYLPPGGGLSQRYTEGGLFNGITFDTVADTPTDCATCVNNKSSPAPGFHERAYFTGDCSGSPIVDSDQSATHLTIAKIGSTWHVMVRFFTILFFYGTTTDLSTPVTNQLTSCNTTPAPLVNDFTTCFGLDATDFAVLGHGGTATLAIVACPP